MSAHKRARVRSRLDALLRAIDASERSPRLAPDGLIIEIMRSTREYISQYPPARSSRDQAPPLIESREDDYVIPPRVI